MDFAELAQRSSAPTQESKQESRVKFEATNAESSVRIRSVRITKWHFVGSFDPLFLVNSSTPQLLLWCNCARDVR